MISMRVCARNLVSGQGLNWARQGRPVEGFTHPLWMALMVPANLLPLALDRRPLLVPKLRLARFFLLWNVALVGRLVRRHFCVPGALVTWLPACVMTAFYYPLCSWALVGMETALQALLTTAMVLLALDIVDGRRDRHLALWLTATAAVLLRLDMILVVTAVLLYVAARGGLRHGERAGAAGMAAWRRYPGWFAGLGCLLLATGGYELFRWLYFHDLLPNTYYLKLGGIPLWLRLLRGRNTLLDTWRTHGPLLATVGLGVGLQPLLGRRRGQRGDSQPGEGWGARLALPAGLFLLCCAYSVWVGGDVWEDEERANRFVAFAVPLVFVLFNALANQAPLAAVARRPGGALALAPARRAGGGHRGGPAGGRRPAAAA